MHKTVILALCTTLGLTAAGAIFEETFEDESADAGSPARFSTYGHEIADRGVTGQTSASGKQSAYIVTDLTKDTWGVIMVHDYGEWNLRGATLSAAVQASTDLSGKQGIVGFKLVDSDGTGYRTDLMDLGKVSGSWSTFSQPANALIQDEEKGDEPGLDLEQIVQYSIIFFDRQDHNKMTTFYVDDFKAVKE